MKWGKMVNKNSKNIGGVFLNQIEFCIKHEETWHLNFKKQKNKSVSTFFYYCVIVGQFLKESFEDPSVDKVLDHSWRTGAQIAGL